MLLCCICCEWDCNCWLPTTDCWWCWWLRWCDDEWLWTYLSCRLFSKNSNNATTNDKIKPPINMKKMPATFFNESSLRDVSCFSVGSHSVFSNHHLLNNSVNSPLSINDNIARLIDSLWMRDSISIRAIRYCKWYHESHIQMLTQWEQLKKKRFELKSKFSKKMRRIPKKKSEHRKRKLQKLC